MTTAKKYAEIKLKIADLSDKMRELEDKILNDMLNEGKNYIELDSGRISMTHRKKWIYTEAVDKLAIKLKERKLIEEIKGIADYTEDLGLMFKSY